VTGLPLMFGDQVGVALVLPGRPPAVIASGPVVRIDEVPGVPVAGSDTAVPVKARTRVAVRFDRISQEDQERITGYILAAHRRRASSSRADGEEAAAAEAVANLDDPAPAPAPEATAEAAPEAAPAPGAQAAGEPAAARAAAE
jgi:hypothetical protein